MSGRKGSPSGPRAAFIVTLTNVTVDSMGNASAGFWQQFALAGVRAGDIVIPNNDVVPVPSVAALFVECQANNYVNVSFQNWTGAPVNSAGCNLSFLVVPL